MDRVVELLGHEESITDLSYLTTLLTSPTSSISFLLDGTCNCISKVLATTTPPVPHWANTVLLTTFFPHTMYVDLIAGKNIALKVGFFKSWKQKPKPPVSFVQRSSDSTCTCSSPKLHNIFSYGSGFALKVDAFTTEHGFSEPVADLDPSVLQYLGLTSSQPDPSRAESVMYMSIRIPPERYSQDNAHSTSRIIALLT